MNGRRRGGGAANEKDFGKRIALWLGIIATAVTIITGIVQLWPEASPQSSRFFGVVKDQQGRGVPGAEIEVRSQSEGALIGSKTSEPNGEFGFPVKAKWEETVFVRVSKKDSIGFEGYLILQGNHVISFAPFKRKSE